MPIATLSKTLHFGELTPDDLLGVLPESDIISAFGGSWEVPPSTCTLDLGPEASSSPSPLSSQPNPASSSPSIPPPCESTRSSRPLVPKPSPAPGHSPLAHTTPDNSHTDSTPNGVHPKPDHPTTETTGSISQPPASSKRSTSPSCSMAAPSSNAGTEIPSTQEATASSGQEPQPESIIRNPPAASPAPVVSKPAPPKVWADLLRSSNAGQSGQSGIVSITNGIDKSRNGLGKKDAAGRKPVKTLTIPRGLINSGNTCWFNAILHPLVHCPQFKQILKHHVKLVKPSPVPDYPLLHALSDFMAKFPTSSVADEASKDDPSLAEIGDAFVPEDVYSALKTKIESMRGHQEDAEEFLGFILDGLHEELVALGEKSGKPLERAEKDAWTEVGPKNKPQTVRKIGSSESAITQLFGGKLRSIISYPGAKNNPILERFHSLQLEISGPKIFHLHDALRNLTASEILDEYVSSTKGRKLDGVTKRILIDSTPPVLIIHFKRFVFDNWTPVKLSKHVSYPLTLKLTPDILSPGWSEALPEYQLFAVIYHHGQYTNGGHYTCDVMREYGDWLRMDDELVTFITADEVCEEKPDRQPYLLFYRSSK
ncbi:uncharacterized protein BJ171DRAFT_485030 [Polychytrium aggregatum]|uniref:uncharacterized protein n=1 Tax=Polychytrium aggregatum TaxID=110093 RepID=UPI0022FEA1EB|nr:uncharacterized protein BJ171DRAFT_485030 [Polychytrium aggregatum]KAI9209789.1 hypothetical protein BJ171DRAFT_485030 [Polychytrium aggregatum]